MKEQDKTPEKQLNEVEIGKLPEKEFRIMIVKMIQDLLRTKNPTTNLFKVSAMGLKKKKKSQNVPSKYQS